MAATVMTFPQDNMDDDDAAVWERLTRGVKAYEPERPPARAAAPAPRLHLNTGST